MIEGMILLWALFGAGKGIVKAISQAGASGARAGAAAAGRRTATARSHPNRAVRGVGHTAHGAGVVLAGLGRGAVAGGKAAAQGAREGWSEGRERGRRRAEAAAPARREAREAREERRRERRDARRLAAGRHRRGRRDPDAETSQTDPADGASPRDGESGRYTGGTRRWGDPDPDDSQPDDDQESTRNDERLHMCANCRSVEVDYRGWICQQCVRAGAPLPGHDDETPSPSPADPSEGADTVATDIPTGEVQGKADTEKALAGFRGAVTTYQDDAAVMKQEAGECRATARRLADDLGSAELGTDTMERAAGCAEWADILDRAADQLITECEAVLAVIAEFEGAVSAHDAVEAAALANQDGGTTEFHRE